MSLRRRSAGFTLMEMAVTAVIVAILAGVAIPMAKNTLRRQKELELRRTLREMRMAIDTYKNLVDRKVLKDPPSENFGYPESLDILVEGAPLNGKTTKLRLLRRIPVDPITGNTDWGFRSVQDSPSATGWGGGSVYDVYSKANGVGMNGIPYKEW